MKFENPIVKNGGVMGTSGAVMYGPDRKTIVPFDPMQYQPSLNNNSEIEQLHLEIGNQQSMVQTPMLTQRDFIDENTSRINVAQVTQNEMTLNNQLSMEDYKSSCLEDLDSMDDYSDQGDFTYQNKTQEAQISKGVYNNSQFEF